MGEYGTRPLKRMAASTDSAASVTGLPLDGGEAEAEWFRAGEGMGAGSWQENPSFHHYASHDESAMSGDDSDHTNVSGGGYYCGGSPAHDSDLGGNSSDSSGTHLDSADEFDLSDNGYSSETSTFDDTFPAAADMTWQTFLNNEMDLDPLSMAAVAAVAVAGESGGGTAVKQEAVRGYSTPDGTSVLAGMAAPVYADPVYAAAVVCDDPYTIPHPTTPPDAAGPPQPAAPPPAHRAVKSEGFSVKSEVAARTPPVIRPGGKQACLLCQFCGATPDQADSGADGDDAARTRKRRRVNARKERKEFKTGKWWRGIGYKGEAYCQRCSEVFRDHLLRQKSNSAKCTRENPCDDCAKILVFFPLEPERWTLYDSKQTDKDRKKRAKNAEEPLMWQKTTAAVQSQYGWSFTAGIGAACVLGFVVAIMFKGSGASGPEPPSYSAEAHPGKGPGGPSNGNMVCPTLRGTQYWLNTADDLFQWNKPGWEEFCLPCLGCQGRGELVEPCQKRFDAVCVEWQRPSPPAGGGSGSSVTLPPERHGALAWSSMDEKHMFLYGGQRIQGAVQNRSVGMAHTTVSLHDFWQFSVEDQTWEEVEPAVTGAELTDRVPVGAVNFVDNRGTVFVFSGRVEDIACVRERSVFGGDMSGCWANSGLLSFNGSMWKTLRVPDEGGGVIDDAASAFADGAVLSQSSPTMPPPRLFAATGAVPFVNTALPPVRTTCSGYLYGGSQSLSGGALISSIQHMLGYGPANPEEAPVISIMLSDLWSYECQYSDATNATIVEWTRLPKPQDLVPAGEGCSNILSTVTCEYASGTADVLAAATMTWPSSRHRHAAWSAPCFGSKHCFYIFGGTTSSNNIVLNDLWLMRDKLPSGHASSSIHGRAQWRHLGGDPSGLTIGNNAYHPENSFDAALSPVGDNSALLAEREARVCPDSRRKGAATRSWPTGRHNSAVWVAGRHAWVFGGQIAPCTDEDTGEVHHYTAELWRFDFGGMKAAGMNGAEPAARPPGATDESWARWQLEANVTAMLIPKVVDVYGRSNSPPARAGTSIWHLGDPHTTEAQEYLVQAELPPSWRIVGFSGLGEDGDIDDTFSRGIGDFGFGGSPNHADSNPSHHGQ